MPRDRMAGSEPSDRVESAFLSRMRELALKGGAATKKRHGRDPRYYRSIGRLGGYASVVARKARIAAELETATPGETPIVESFDRATEMASVQPQAPVSLKEILADLERDEPRVSNPSNCRQPSADLQAERDFTSWVARIREQDAGCVEPWDPWSKP